MKSKNFQLSEPKTGSFFNFTDDLFKNQSSAFADPSSNHILWNPTDTPIQFFCDDRIVSLPKSSFCTVTALNFLKLEEKESPLTCISFNREFYCLRDHDHEVSCNGILFYGAQSFPILQLNQDEDDAFRKLSDLFLKEFGLKDPMQGEMLVSLLKVMIILLTRIGKSRIQKINGSYQEIETIRQFNLLVDANFRKKKSVQEYAFLLGVNPKKLSEVFRIAKLNPPLITIHNRIILEAKRLLLFSLKSITEISDDLGFEDISQFTKLFKKYTNESPSQFRIGSGVHTESNKQQSNKGKFLESTTSNHN